MNSLCKRHFCLILFACAALLSAVSVSAAENLWFPLGEQLVHKVYWGIIPVGRSVTTSRSIQRDGREYIQIKIRTRTSGIFDKIRKVDDIVESIVDPVTFLPVRFSRKMIRNKEVCNEHTVFDYVKLSARWENFCTGEVKTFSIEEDTQDALSFLYKMREKNMAEDMDADYRVMADEGMFDIKIRTSKKENINLPLYGDISSLRIDPVFDFDGLLVAGGEFTLWVSDDDRRILTKAQINRKLFDIRVVLQAVVGPGNDAWVQPTSSEDSDYKVMSDDQIEKYLAGE